MTVSAEDLTYIEYEGKKYVSFEEAIRFTGYKLNTLYVYRYRRELQTYTVPGYGSRRKFFLLDELVAFKNRERYPLKTKPQLPMPMLNGAIPVPTPDEIRQVKQMSRAELLQEVVAMQRREQEIAEQQQKMAEMRTRVNSQLAAILESEITGFANQVSNATSGLQQVLQSMPGGK